MSKPLIYISLVIVVFFSFILFRDFLARLSWEKFSNPKIAVFFLRTDAETAMLIGNYYFNGVVESGQYNLDIAEQAFQKAVLINSKVLWGYHQLARVYFIKGHYDRAIDAIYKELEHNPENLRALYVRGLIYGYRSKEGDLEKAEQDFLRFTKWAPKEWAGYNDLAWVLSKQGEYREAEKTINEALKEALNANDNPWLWNSLGVAQLNLRKYQAAVDSFKKASKLAAKITQEEWRASYPGNNPATADDGLSAFLKAIEKNSETARNGVDKKL